MNPKSISMIQKQLKTYFKVKYVSIFIGYYKAHGVGNMKIIWDTIIKIYWLIVIKLNYFYNYYKNVFDLQYYAQY